MVDGDGSEWGDRGLPIGVIRSKEGTPSPAADLAIRSRLGWGDEGLLQLLAVHDDIPVEHPSMTKLWSKDRYVRGDAAQALLRIGTRQAWETVMPFLETSRWCPLTTKESTY